MNSISPQLQNQIAQFQQLQQQLQAVTSQKIQMEAQVKEIERTMEELCLHLDLLAADGLELLLELLELSDLILQLGTDDVLAASCSDRCFS